MSDPNHVPNPKDVSGPKDVLRSAKSILLVDWSSPTVPRTLVEAGFTVFTSSPGSYSVVELASEPSAGIDANGSNYVVPASQTEIGHLIFRRLSDKPAHVDIVNVYRPENEHEAIVLIHLLPLGAKVLWLQPSIASATARKLALKYRFELVEGVDIAAAAAR